MSLVLRFLPIYIFRFLVTGNSYCSMVFSYRISPYAVGVIVPEVCRVIWAKLKGIYMRMPSDGEDWKLIAKHFEVIWNFPGCIGAIDGKHIQITAPRRTGALYYNYKGTFSTVPMASVDANYKFVYVDIGSHG